MYIIIKKLRIIQILFYGIAQVMKKVLHGIILAFGATDKAARCEYAPNIP